MTDDIERLGATPLGADKTHFCVWAPSHSSVDVCLGARRTESLRGDERGYYRVTLEGIPPGSRYSYRLSNDLLRPDPASRSQPGGVHEASEVIDLNFAWTDQRWPGLPLSRYVLYELHVGTFTHEGTFDAVVGHLDGLRELGVTAIELMPVAQFPGTRNWGYDGVYPFAVQSSYGGPRGLQRLVDACHERELAVVLDVVYNHLGPEGNGLADFGPYFTSAYRTPWGEAINFDGPGSDEVRRYFIENALQWIRDFHVDALRLDAVHAIMDRSAHPFLEELSRAVHDLGNRLGRTVALIAESDLNDSTLVRVPEIGGYGLDSMWCDDLHHATHTLLTGERDGYYQDYGRIDHLARAWARGATYAGEFSRFRKRRHGRIREGLSPHQIVVCVQNHDQVGNRPGGERLSALVGFEAEKLSAGVVALAPHLPLLFMGQEYGESAPFQYFVSHSDPELVEAVRQGRKDEFSSFDWPGDVPDPQSEDVFRRCVLDHDLSQQGCHAILWRLYQQLLSLRQRYTPVGMDEAMAFEVEKVLFVRRGGRAWMAFHFGGTEVSVALPVSAGRWVRSFDSAEEDWAGPGTSLPHRIDSEGEVRVTVAPFSFAVYTAEPKHEGERADPGTSSAS